MTLALYTKNRAASSFDGNLQNLEVNIVLTLANKCAHLSDSIIADDGSMVTEIAELPDECSLVDDTNADMANNNKRPFTPDQAADIVDAALEDYRIVTPPSTHERSAKKARISYSSKPRSSCTFPTADDPMDESFCMKLSSMDEEGKIHPTLIVLRRDVLEIRTKSGKIFFQCACRKLLSRGDSTKQSTLTLQSIRNLYRAVIRFMKYNAPACEHIPQEIKDLSPTATRDVKACDTKEYWAKSA